MGKNIFCVTNESNSVYELFEEREYAIAFIVDEFSMCLTFRDDEEGERLTKYMETHNETPNQYPYKYFIKETKMNHDYDKPKSTWMVTLLDIDGNDDIEKQYIFSSYEDAREQFDELVDEDIKRYGESTNHSAEVGSFNYFRWDSENGSAYAHCHITLKEFSENGIEIVKNDNGK